MKASAQVIQLSLWTTKTCRKCQKLKQLTDFHKSANGTKDGRHSICKRCDYERVKRDRKDTQDRSKVYRRRQLLKSLYGMTEAQYDHLLAAQGGGCAVCSSTIAATRRPNLFVDHCHSTGKVRGLLCGNCNSGIGWFRDDPLRMRRAAEYIERANG